ncbi:MAG TPA: TonB-dependent receptor [Burkholderiaceae bacterium]|jgi:iron complex outermembrane receptor protein
MFRTTKVCSALMVAFGGSLAMTAAPVFAQDANPPVQQLERVEITGSAIKRIDAETAVPVTILKVEDVKKQGITTVEQLMTMLGSNQQSQGATASVGLQTGGASFANLRGLGQNKTLVLLNGRRIANNAIDSSAPDLNMIPFAALDRVEVLRDGASALYGTDAIGGVINFITKRDYSGGTITLGYDQPEHVGGKQTNANFGFGFGDLSKDRFNVFGFVDYKKQSVLTASQRPDLLARSVKTSPTSAPGQYNQSGAVQNPSFPTCGAPNGIPLGDGVTDATCGYLYARAVDLIPQTETLTAYTKATFQLGDNHQAGLEYFISKNSVLTTISGVPYGALWINPGTRYFPGNGITPLPSVFALDPTYLPAGAPTGAQAGGVALRWRDTASGGRQQLDDNLQQRLVGSLEGTLGGWDYKAGIAFNSNLDHGYLPSGYTDGDLITAGILNGTLNPFGPQDATGAAFLASAQAKGNLYNTRGDVKSIDAQASREIGDWFKAGRAAAIAVGGEFRRETFFYQANADFAAQVVSSTGFSPDTDNKGSRNVAAIYTELNVPIIKELDITAALRYDRYSDFGNTTNPKLSFRYQPVQPLLVRGSYSTGFRAPSLYDLYAPRVFTNTPDNLNDPVRCPGGNPIAGASRSDNCQVQFESQIGGSPNLRPEKSKNWTLGFVVEPSSSLNFGVDFWWITLTQQIGAPLDTDIFTGYAGQYAGSIHRAPDGSLSTDGSQCPGPNCGYIDQFQTNLGGVKTAGVDLSANYKMRLESVGNFNFNFNGTYVYKFQYQTADGGPYFNNLGVYGGGVALSAAQGGPVFRWQHTLAANWTRGDYGLGLVNHYKSGYTDQDPSNTVASYMTWDLYGSWQATKGLQLTAGVRNLADRQPPLSNQSATFQVGYDPRFTDPSGRTFFLRGTYNF